MNTQHFLSSFSRAKKAVAELISEISFGKMVADNLADIIPAGWKLESDNYRGDLYITPIEETKVTADQFDKIVSKFAKISGVKPSIYISTLSMNGTIYFYRSPEIGSKRHSRCTVRVEIRTANTEACEIIYEDKVEQVPVLTGYCKALSEKDFLK